MKEWKIELDSGWCPHRYVRPTETVCVIKDELPCGVDICPLKPLNNGKCNVCACGSPIFNPQIDGSIKCDICHKPVKQAQR